MPGNKNVQCHVQMYVTQHLNYNEEYDCNYINFRLMKRLN